MKTQQVNLRLEADLIAALERAAKEEALDRGTMLRKLLLEALDRRRLERTLELYQRGEISLGRASEETRLTQWELLELARSRRIAYPLTPDEADRLPPDSLAEVALARGLLAEKHEPARRLH